MRYAIINNNGVVDNVVMADARTAQLIAGARRIVQSDTANKGDSYNSGKFTGFGEEMAPASIAPIVDMEMRRRITDAYVSDVHMRSAHAWISQLTAEMQLGSISDADKNDLRILLTGGRWEDNMVTARDAIIASGDAMKMHDESSWPAVPAGLTDLAGTC